MLAACAHGPYRPVPSDALNAEEHIRLGATYEAQGLRVEAVRQYEAAISRRPDLPDGWMALGNLAFGDGRLKDAEAAFRRALKISPHHPGASNNLAMALVARGGDLAEAEALTKDGLEGAGTLRVYLLDTLANVHLRQGRLAEALDAITQAEAAAAPDNLVVRDQLAVTRKGIEAERGKP